MAILEMERKGAECKDEGSSLPLVPYASILGKFLYSGYSHTLFNFEFRVR